MKLRLQKIPAFDARRGGLKRSHCAGLDMRDRRHLASAEVWHTRDQHTLLRFSACGMRAHFRATSSRGASIAGWTCKQLETAVHEQLASWFCDVYDNED
ncbi:hypothetical protein BH20VER1_BH20VER1_31470 [soil metagenome]